MRRKKLKSIKAHENDDENGNGDDNLIFFHHKKKTWGVRGEMS